MSLGSSRSSPPTCPGTPSTTTSTSVLPVVDTPRMRNCEPSYPGSPPRFVATSPENLPASELDRLGCGLLISSAPFTSDTEPVTVARLWVPYPTTTTSSRAWASSSNTTSRVVCVAAAVPSMVISSVKNPTKLKTTTSPPAPTVSWYRPASSVVVVVPACFRETVTPAIGLPAASRTTPDTVVCDVAETYLS